MTLSLVGIERAWRRRAVLTGVDFELEGGTIAAIAGANGAGKTTLLRVAAGLLGPDAGQISLDGLDPVADRREYQRKISLLAAGDRGLYPRLTTVQTLELCAGLALMPRRTQRDLIERARERFSLGELWKSRVDRLSLGQRQRLRLALAFLHDPAVALLDEPNTSLDDAGLELICDAMRAHADGGGAVLWCAPAPERTGLPADRVLALEHGRLHEA